MGGPQTIRRESAASCIAACISLRAIHTGNELRQKSKIAAIQRKIINVSLIDHLPDGSVLRLQYRNCPGNFNRLRLTAGLQSEIQADVRADVYLHAGLRGRLETLGGNVQFIVPDPDWRELVYSIRAGRRRQRCAGSEIGQRNFGSTNHGFGLICYRADD